MSRPYRDLPGYVRLLGGLVVAATLVFLAAPLLTIIPLSFSSEPWFTYPLPGTSLRWYEALWSSSAWRGAIGHSFLVAGCTVLLATPLGALAAFALVRPGAPGRRLLLALFLSPMIVPVVVLGLGIYLFFIPYNLTNSFAGLILAHTVLASPFVVITMAATLSRFDFTLMRAAASLGASKSYAVRTVMLPIVAPGVMAGALMAFVTSFDEIVIALFIAGPAQRTLPRQMFTGIREEINPTIIAASVAVILVTLFLLLLTELLRRRAAAAVR